MRLDPALGGGCLWDLGVYPIGYARLMIGAEPVEAFGWQTLGPTGVDMSFAGQLRFPGDVMLQCDTSFRTAFRRDVEIVGSEATLFVPNPFKPDPGRGLGRPPLPGRGGGPGGRGAPGPEAGREPGRQPRHRRRDPRAARLGPREPAGQGRVSRTFD